jgi:hypothetical protein
MKERFLGYILLFIFLSTGSLLAEQGSRIVHFTIFLKDKTVLRLDSRNKRVNVERSAFDIIEYKKEGRSFQEVKKIEWPEVTRNIYSIDFINSNRLVYSKNKLLLTKQDNTQKVIPYGSLHYPDGTLMDTLYFSEYNRVADRWTDASIPIERVKKLVLGTTQLMINTKSGTLYPPDYRYDPHTGDPLAETALTED